MIQHVITLNPRVDIQNPNYTVANTNVGPQCPWTDMAKGSIHGNELIVITASNGQYSYSTDGNSFTAADLSEFAD